MSSVFLQNNIGFTDIESWHNFEPLSENLLSFIWNYSIYLDPDPTRGQSYDNWVKTLTVEQANRLLAQIRLKFKK
jgi:hypothetical protein